MTTQERPLLFGCAAGLQIAEACHRRLEACYRHVILRGLARRVAGGFTTHLRIGVFWGRALGAEGLNRNLSGARAVSAF